MATRWHSQAVLVLMILLAACSKDEQPRQDMARAQCQADQDSLREAENKAMLLTAERDELQAALERVTQELVMVKVERDKMAVELRAYKRMSGTSTKTQSQDVMKKQ